MTQSDLSIELVNDFITMMDAWHGAPEVWDDELDAQIHEMYADVLRNPPKLDWGPKGTKYLAPSSANSDARELYARLTGAPKDSGENQPHQGRWRRVGTAFGDVIQRDLLFIEKHFKNKLGKEPAYRPIKNQKGQPMWEQFAKKILNMDYDGVKVRILGQPDGILVHSSGLKVGLEIKSKQTTSSKTSAFSMKEPGIDHVKQVIAYSIMYDVDDYLIVYGNLSKKSWNMSKEDYEKNPDLRVFHVHVTDDMKEELMDYFADVIRAVEAKTPPKIELDKWTFNNYKTAIAKSLTEEEFTDVKKKISAVIKSNLSDRAKQDYLDAYNFIDNVRNNLVD